MSSPKETRVKGLVCFLMIVTAILGLGIITSSEGNLAGVVTGVAVGVTGVFVIPTLYRHLTSRKHK